MNSRRRNGGGRCALKTIDAARVYIGSVSMIRVVRPSGEILALDGEGLATVLDVAMAVKSALGIPRGQQHFLLNDEVLPMLSELPHLDVLLTLVRVPEPHQARRERAGRSNRSTMGARSAAWHATPWIWNLISFPEATRMSDVCAFRVGFELSFVAMVDVRAYVTQSILVQAGSSIVNT